MINTQTQIDSLIDLAVLQRTELKQLVDSLPQLRDHLSSEIERNLEEIEPAIRAELEQFVAARALDTQAKTSAELTAKLDAMARNLESTTAAKYSVLMAERAQNATLLAQAEARIAEAASALPGAVKGIVTDELARFPRAGEIDQLRKEFAEPRGLNPRGRWQVGETYNKLDLVSYNGDSYVSNTDGNREKPSRSSEAWTLSAARGNGGAGGGVTSLTDLVAVPANGELLIGNGSAFVNNTLTAGTGVTITNGPGTITIDASGAQEILTATVTNAESFAITRGQVVYLFGATGNRASVKLADNSNDAASSKTFGVVSEASIAAGANGLVTCVGVVDKLTLGSYTEGDVLYLGATPGSVTATKPYAPNHLVYVGIVERANNGNGELYVKIQNGYELDEIHDVQITTPPLAGSLLMRDATNSLWKANRLTGTANQVTVTNADTSVTLSLPTAIANVNSVTAATTQNLTLTGGSTGASLVLGQGATASALVTPAGVGGFLRVLKAMPSTSQFTSVGSIQLINTDTTANNWNSIDFVDSIGGGTAAGIYAKHTDHANDYAELHLVTRGAGGLASRGIFTETGNLLIGTTTDGGQKLQVNGTSYFSSDLSSAGTITSIGANDGYFIATRSTTSRYALFTYRTGVADDWVIGLRGSGEGFSDDLTYRNGSGAVVSRLSKAGAATFAGAVTTGGKITSSVSTATGYNQLYDTTGITTGRGAFAITSTGAGLAFGVESSVGGTSFTGSTAYASYFGTTTATPIHFVTNSAIRATIGSTGAATFAGAVTVSNTTASTNTSTGAVVIGNGTAGGLGVGGSIRAGSQIVSGYATVGGATPGGAFTASSSDPRLFLNNTSAAADTGSWNFRADSSGTLQISTGNDAVTTGTVALSITRTTGTPVALTVNTSTATFAGAVSVNSATPSTGAGSGALQVAGGLFAGAASVFGSAVTLLGTSSQLNFTDTGSGTSRNWRFASSEASEGDFLIQVSSAANLVPSISALGFDRTGAATFAGAVTTGGNLTLPAAPAAANRYILTGTSNTGTGQLVIQAGGGSTGWGGNLNLFETAHATKGGWVGVGLGVSGAKFTVNSTGFSESGEVASIDRTGAATFAGAVTAPSATIKRASTSEDAFTNFYTGGSPYWTVGLQAVGTSNDFRIVNAQSGNRSLSISTTTEAATFAGTVIAPAATTAISSVRLPHGAAPTSPVNGDMWTTTAGLYVRINGVTVGPLS